jgi:hypothetical protein
VGWPQNLLKVVLVVDGHLNEVDRPSGTAGYQNLPRHHLSLTPRSGRAISVRGTRRRAESVAASKDPCDVDGSNSGASTLLARDFGGAL